MESQPATHVWDRVLRARGTAAITIAWVVMSAIIVASEPATHPLHEIVNLGSSHAMSNAETLKSALEMLPKEVDAKDAGTGETGMLMAARKGRRDMVEVFLSFKADPNARARDGSTALMLAALRQDRGMAALLINHGADVNARAEGGVSALMLAAHAGAADLVRMLLDKGADVNHRSEAGESALIWVATDGGHRQVAELLLSQGADMRRDGGLALARAVMMGRKEMVALLLKHGADPNFQEKQDGIRPLHIAAYENDLAVAEALLGAGADSHATDADGDTPADVARRLGHADMMRLFPRHGARHSRKESGQASGVLEHDGTLHLGG